MAMNPQNLMMIMSAWSEFQKNHPKFPAFLQAVKSQGIREDTIIEIASRHLMVKKQRQT